MRFLVLGVSFGLAAFFCQTNMAATSASQEDSPAETLIPSITSTEPGWLPMGQNNPVEVYGTGFVPGTVIYLNGSAEPTVYQSSSRLRVLLSAEPGIGSPEVLVAKNPGSSSASASFDLPLGAPSNSEASIGTTPEFAIPKGFLGFSHEWGDAQDTMGQASRGVNRIYRQLLSNLMDSPSSPFLIRIGGGSTDDSTTIYNVQAFNELHAALPGVQFTAGITLGKSLNSTPAAAVAEAKQYVSSMTPGSLASIEIGNETDVYQYQAGPVQGRNRNYTFDVFNQKYAEWVKAVTQSVSGPVPGFTGPSWALLRSLLNDQYWSHHIDEPPSYLERFIAMQQGHLDSVTQHFYGGLVPGSFPASYLLSSAALQYQNPGESQPYWVPSILGHAANIAHEHGMTFRVNEMNSIDGGGMPGTSNSFTSALWAIDTMFEFANARVDGVNWHGARGGVRVTAPGGTCKVEGVIEQAPCIPDAIYAAFTFGQSRQNGVSSYALNSVNPLYYGLYFFHLAVPDGAQMLPVTLKSPHHVKVWATRDASGTMRIAVINKDETYSGILPIRIPGYGDAQTLELKDVHGYTGTIYFANDSTAIGSTGITIAGQTFDGSKDGRIQGKKVVGQVNPREGVYSVPVEPGSAVLLIVSPIKH